MGRIGGASCKILFSPMPQTMRKVRSWHVVYDPGPALTVTYSILDGVEIENEKNCYNKHVFNYIYNEYLC